MPVSFILKKSEIRLKSETDIPGLVEWTVDLRGERGQWDHGKGTCHTVIE